MGIPRKGGQCFSVIYLNIVPLIIKTFTKYLKTHASEQTHTKKSPEKLCRCPSRAIKRQLTCPIEFTSGSSLIGRNVFWSFPGITSFSLDPSMILSAFRNTVTVVSEYLYGEKNGGSVAARPMYYIQKKHSTKAWWASTPRGPKRLVFLQVHKVALGV